MIKIGVLCPSEIAFRRFLPAVMKVDDIQYCGVAMASEEEWFGKNCESVSEELRKKTLSSEYEKAKKFQETYGGKIWKSYTEMVKSSELDAIYIPLPPALHYKWAKFGLEEGKHILVEKPSTISLDEFIELYTLAEEKKLALYENYMFVFHEQLKEINHIIDSKEIGEVRLYRMAFGFPQRDKDDFRYNKALGGGALFDCGGYAIKYASMLLGDSAAIVYSQMNYTDEFDVDIYGSAALINDKGVTAQIAYGMDNSYKCELEVWGSKGTLLTKRVFTAPVDFVPECRIETGKDVVMHKFSEDDTFKKSIQRFYDCITDDKVRQDTYKELKRQEILLNEFKKLADKR